MWSRWVRTLVGSWSFCRRRTTSSSSNSAEEDEWGDGEDGGSDADNGEWEDSSEKKIHQRKQPIFSRLETIIDSWKKIQKNEKNRLFRCLLNNFNAFWNHTISFKLKYLRLYKRVNLFFPCTRIFFKLCKKAILVILKYKVSRSNLAICRYCTVHQR